MFKFIMVVKLSFIIYDKLKTDTSCLLLTVKTRDSVIDSIYCH